MATFQEEMEIDLECIFSEEEFAIPATYNGVLEGEVVPLSIIFDDPFAASSPGTQLSVQDIQPTARVIKSKLPGQRVRPGDWMLVEGKEYLCKESQPDGVGTIIIELKVK